MVYLWHSLPTIFAYNLMHAVLLRTHSHPLNARSALHRERSRYMYQRSALFTQVVFGFFIGCRSAQVIVFMSLFISLRKIKNKIKRLKYRQNKYCARALYSAHTTQGEVDNIRVNETQILQFANIKNGIEFMLKLNEDAWGHDLLINIKAKKRMQRTRAEE